MGRIGHEVVGEMRREGTQERERWKNGEEMPEREGRYIREWKLSVRNGYRVGATVESGLVKRMEGGESGKGRESEWVGRRCKIPPDVDINCFIALASVAVNRRSFRNHRTHIALEAKTM